MRWLAPAGHLGELRITGPDHAVAAFRCILQADAGGQLLVALVLDQSQRLRGTCMTTRAAEEASSWLWESVLPAIPDDGPTAIVLIASRPDGSTVPTPDEVAAWREATELSTCHGVALLDLLIVSGQRWRSLSLLSDSTARNTDSRPRRAPGLGS
jgi:RadC-like JAB domain